MAKFLIFFVAIIIVIACCSYNYGISKVSNSNENKQILITENDTYYSIANKLKENNLIRSITFYKVYIKIFNPQKLYTGTYNLNESMGVKKIVSTLSKTDTIGGINITFREGLNMRKITNLIVENTNNTSDDVYNLLNDKDYQNELIDLYWFIDEDIKNEKLYYSLEGYLFPETYNFADKNVSVREIFKVMLDEMDKKLLPLKEEINNSKYSIHQLLTLASIVELEGANSDDRASVAGVFYNRLENNWTLGSDVTTYYSLKIDDWSTSLKTSQLQTCNDYNTRGNCFIGLPVGPICNPSFESIKAVIEPKRGKYYYFLADCTGKTYLTITENEHINMRNKLKNEGKWCDN